MYNRTINWETYLNRYGFKDEIIHGFVRSSPPPITASTFIVPINTLAMIASPAEIQTVLTHNLAATVYPVDPATVTLESLRSSFDWAMGSVLWKLELQRAGLQDLTNSLRPMSDRILAETRRKAEQAFQSGHYSEALSGLLECEAQDYQDFSLHLTIGNIYLYHQRPANLEKARAAYVVAARYADPRAPRYASLAHLWASFVAYLQNDNESAIELAQRAINLTPQLVEARYSQARYAALADQIPQAINGLENAFRSDRNYVIRAVTNQDFAAIVPQMTGLIDRLRLEARQQAETVGRSLFAEIGHSRLPTNEQDTSRRLQAEITERWRQDTYFGFMEAAGKTVRYKVYVEGLRLADRDRLAAEAADMVAVVKRDLDQAHLPAGLARQFHRLLDECDANLHPPVPTKVTVASASTEPAPVKENIPLGTSAEVTEAVQTETRSEVTQAPETEPVNPVNNEETVDEVTTAEPEPEEKASTAPEAVNDQAQVTAQETIQEQTSSQAAQVSTPEPTRDQLPSPAAPVQPPATGVSSLAQAQAAIDLAHQAQSLWETVTIRDVLTGHTGDINALTFSPAKLPGPILLASSGSFDQSIRLWDPMTGDNLSILNGHGDTINSIAFNPDGRLLASAGGVYKGQDFTIRIWDVPARKSREILDGHIQMVNQIAFNPDGKRLASCSADGRVCIWDIPEYERPTSGSAESSQTSAITPTLLDGHNGSASCVAFSPDGQLLASAGEDQTIRLWDLSNAKQAGILLGHDGPVVSIHFIPQGNMLISRGTDQTLRLWDMTHQSLVKVLEQPADITAFALSPAGDHLAWAVGEDPQIRLLPLDTEEDPSLLAGHTGQVTGLAFNVDGSLLASGGADGLVRIWDGLTGQALAIRSGHIDRVLSVAFNPDDTVLATGGRDHQIRLWGLAFTTADTDAIVAEQKERQQKAFEAQQAEAAAAEQQRRAWLASGCCEICGTRLSLGERLTRQTRCKDHRVKN